MKISELINTLEKLMDEYGDVDVKIFDLDREKCDIDEVTFFLKGLNHTYLLNEITILRYSWRWFGDFFYC